MFPKYIHACSPCKIPACTPNICKLGRAISGQGLETGSCLQVAPRPGQVVKKPLVFGWCRGQFLHPRGLILPLQDGGALLHAVLAGPLLMKLHQLPMLKQPKETNAHSVSA